MRKKIYTMYLILLFLWMSGSAMHNLHLSYGKVAVDDTSVLFRISFFPDDFELMLSAFHEKEVANVKHSGDADSLFLPVLDNLFVLKVNGKRAKASILKSGIESDMCWYMLSFASDSSIKKLEIDNRMLFKEFSDQKNMISLLDARTGKKTSFYGTVNASEFSISF